MLSHPFNSCNTLYGNTPNVFITPVGGVRDLINAEFVGSVVTHTRLQPVLGTTDPAGKINGLPRHMSSVSTACGFPGVGAANMVLVTEAEFPFASNRVSVNV
jgi:hypothetical protein